MRDQILKKFKEKVQKTIKVLEIREIASFTTKFEADWDSDLLVEISSRWLKFITNSLPTKNKIVNYLKEQRFQFFNVPYLEARFKIVISLYNSSTLDSIQMGLNKDSFDISQDTQMLSRKDGRMLPLFLLHLPQNENCKKFFETKSLFKIRIDSVNYRAPRKAANC